MFRAEKRIQKALARVGEKMYWQSATDQTLHEIMVCMQESTVPEHTPTVLGMDASAVYTAYFVCGLHQPKIRDCIRAKDKSYTILKIQPFYLAGNILYYRAEIQEKQEGNTWNRLGI